MLLRLDLNFFLSNQATFDQFSAPILDFSISFRFIFAVVEDVVTEFVPLEGAEEGEGNFLGSICSQVEALGGNLDPSETTTQKSRTKIRQCLQEPDILKIQQDFNFLRDKDCFNTLKDLSFTLGF